MQRLDYMSPRNHTFQLFCQQPPDFSKQMALRGISRYHTVANYMRNPHEEAFGTRTRLNENEVKTVFVLTHSPRDYVRPSLRGR